MCSFHFACPRGQAMLDLPARNNVVIDVMWRNLCDRLFGPSEEDVVYGTEKRRYFYLGWGEKLTAGTLYREGRYPDYTNMECKLD